MSLAKRLDSSLNTTVVPDTVGLKGRTKQSFKKECDINHIMGRYLKSGNVDHLVKHAGQFGFAPAYTFQDAMNSVLKAEEMFMDLPSEVRARFGNSPSAFLDFAQRSENIDELRRLKLAPPAPKAPPSSSSAPIAAPGPTQ